TSWSARSWPSTAPETALGAGRKPGPEASTTHAVSSQSTFGPPAAPVAVARIALLPALRLTVTVAVAHVFHDPVPGTFPVTGLPPLTLIGIGRLAVVPLAYRMVSFTLPAADRDTVHST